MDFSEQYLTYDEYKALGGNTLNLTPFNLLEFEARRQIDLRTFNRLKEIDSKDIPQEVKLCMNKLINSISNYVGSTELTTNKNVKSESIDGYSVNYISASELSDAVKSKNDELNDIIRTYLLGLEVNGQHLMYAGI